MANAFLPEHRVWLVRAAATIAAVCAVATWLFFRSIPPVTASTAVVPPPTATASTTELAALARRATVQVVANDRRGAAIAQGTGFFLSADGLIATNYHVIKSARSLQIEMLDGSPLSEVYLVAVDTGRDLAMLRVQRPNGPYLRVASNATPAIGDPVYVMGNPLGQVGTFSTGIVSATRSLPERELIQITAPISPGSSGGPVLNGAGEVIGIATLNLTGGQNMNFAVSSTYLPSMMAAKDSALPFVEVATALADARATRARETEAARSTASRTRSADADIADNAPEIDRQFVEGDSLLGSVGYRPEGPVLHEFLYEGKVNRHPVELRRGTYLIQAYCDNDCARMALSIIDARGSLVDLDTTKTDQPRVLFDVKSPDKFSARVGMVSCAVEPCAYGIRLYRRVTDE